MKRIVTGLLLLFCGLPAPALELQLLHQTVLPHKMKFKKTAIGGLSGLVFDPMTGILTAVSDDRGNVQEPRLYQFKVIANLKEFKIEPANIIFLSVNQSESSHKSTRSAARLFSKVFDLEGMAMAPWGDFLLVNEGDANQKPRVNPQLLDIKPDGTIVREFPVPTDFLPEPTGEQKRGVRNNWSFEGLAASPNGKEWMVATEGPLRQDRPDRVRWIRYQMPEAWVLKPEAQFFYPLKETAEAASGGLEVQKGVSEVHYWNENQILVLERALLLGKQGSEFRVQIYETDLNSVSGERILTSKLVLDMGTLGSQIGKVENFEGMTMGPTLSDGRKTLILVSDDNFMRSQRTQFLLFAVKESSHASTHRLETTPGR